MSIGMGYASGEHKVRPYLGREARLCDILKDQLYAGKALPLGLVIFHGRLKGGETASKANYMLRLIVTR